MPVLGGQPGAPLLRQSSAQNLSWTVFDEAPPATLPDTVLVAKLLIW